MKLLFSVLIAALLGTITCPAQLILPAKVQSDYIVSKQLYNGTYTGLTSYATDYVDSWSSYPITGAGL